MERLDILLPLLLTGIASGEQSTNAPIPESAITRTLYEQMSRTSHDKGRDTNIWDYENSYHIDLQKASSEHHGRKKRFSFWHPFGKQQIDYEYVHQELNGKLIKRHNKYAKKRHHRNRHPRKMRNNGKSRRKMHAHKQNDFIDKQYRQRKTFRYGK
ncbi:uncharacterized protein LOC110462786 [Mizuhopecten yessoensis]|uniref:uncharacterized protein LOC110462786 n=1 Tax=Mizuhopecten yessoensis TaxID=6573 RepID=UPI000B45F2A1|nr:uncharacterized protein LOC110462786 [Mizuhopecten yessoensis]